MKQEDGMIQIKRLKTIIQKINVWSKIACLNEKYVFYKPLESFNLHFPIEESQIFAHHFLFLFVLNHSTLTHLSLQQIKVNLIASVKEAYICLFKILSKNRNNRMELYIFLLCLITEDVFNETNISKPINKNISIPEIAFVTLNYFTLGIFVVPAAFEIEVKKYIKAKKKSPLKISLITTYALDLLKTPKISSFKTQNFQKFRRSLNTKLKQPIVNYQRDNSFSESDQTQLMKNKQIKTNSNFHANQISSSFFHTNRTINHGSSTRIKMKPLCMKIFKDQQTKLYIKKQIVTSNPASCKYSKDKSKKCDLKKWQNKIQTMKENIKKYETQYQSHFTSSKLQTPLKQKIIIPQTYQSPNCKIKQPIKIFIQTNQLGDIKEQQRLISTIQNIQPKQQSKQNQQFYSLSYLKNQRRRFEAQGSYFFDKNPIKMLKFYQSR